MSTINSNIFILERAPSAYSQFWLITHFALFYREDQDAPDLNQYLRPWAEGTPSLEAFESTFGVSPKKLKKYSKRIPYYTIPYDTDQLDNQEIITTSSEDEILPILQYLSVYTKGRTKNFDKVDGYAALNGIWDWARVDNICKEAVNIEVSEDKDAITMERSDGFTLIDDEHYDRLKYRVQSGTNNELLLDLDQEWRRNAVGALVSWSFVLLSDDWFCW